MKFFDAYEQEGVSFWGLTVQNEPAGNTGGWQDLKMSAAEERDFIKTSLGPAIASSNHSHLKLMMFDDQRIRMKEWADTILRDPEAAKYVAGSLVQTRIIMPQRRPVILFLC